MKNILKNGKISVLTSDDGGEGWSGEVHLLTYEGRKYVLRKYKTLKRAKYFEEISHKLEKYGFLPKFLGRVGKDVLYEYIEGRDLIKKESKSVIYRVGKICAYINKIKVNGSVTRRFEKNLNEVRKAKLLPKEEIERVEKIYQFLLKKTKPIFTLDANDLHGSNLRLRNGNVYLVDIDSIAERPKLFAIGKAFFKWFKKPKEQKQFRKGYSSISSTQFWDEKYQDFIFLNWLLQDIYYCHYFKEKKYAGLSQRKEQLGNLLSKYGNLK
ncbi:MAG: hypothetical protein AABX23_04450 [Nanoarchaeota archaeon]